TMANSIPSITMYKRDFGTCGIANSRWTFPRIRQPKVAGSSNDERIVGGVTAQPGQWPWVVSLTYDGDAKCGASLLTERYLLTAAHCFRDRPDASRWAANLGSLDFLRPNEPGEQHIRLARVRIHPNHGLRSRDDFDVAVLELSSPVAYSDKIRPICVSELPPRSGERCTVAGWGLTFFTAPYNLLNQVTVPVIRGSRCNSSDYPDLAGRITDSMFCAGYPQGGRDACD
uniref:Peptidase S1 domain-containing protein n=1 Tax=Macrostomum lignano TaxID=282301 RepID=A0A1I8GVZ4_9PLAT